MPRLSYPKVAVENFDIKFVECAAVFAHTQRKVDAGKTGGGGQVFAPLRAAPPWKSSVSFSNT